jgi:magnesium transporter
MIGNLLQPEIKEALDARNFGMLRSTLGDWPARDVADVIEQLEDDDRALLFRLLPREQAAETFEYLEAEAQESLIKGLGREQVATVLNDMAPDDRTALLEELPASVTRELLALLSVEERLVARQLLGYPEDSIGRRMTPEYIAVPADWTVQQALEHVREHGWDSETLNVIYVVDSRGKLIDDLRMRELLLQSPTATIDAIRDGNFMALKATDDQEEAIQVFSETDRVALPVTDSTGALLGIVTVDDVLDVQEEEATEDIQKIGGMEALEHSYMQAPFWELVQKRGGWLVLLFLGQLLTLHAMGFFEHRLQEAFVVVMFVPLIISSGGNSGAQAATLVVRAMALDEVGLGDWWRVMRREMAFGLTIGLVLAVVGVLRIWGGKLLDEPVLTVAGGPPWAEVALAIGLSVVCVVLWGVIIGSMLPFLMRRVGVDPATSSTPFVATIVDVTGLVLYFSVALVILR